LLWRSQGVTIPFFKRDRLVCVHEHFETSFYSQAPRDAQFMRPPLRVQKPMAVISGSVPGRLDPNSVSVLTRYLYRCLTIKTKLTTKVSFLAMGQTTAMTTHLQHWDPRRARRMVHVIGFKTWWMPLDSNQQCLSGGRFTVSWGYQFSYTSIY
jgi:hypothetical protein